MRLRVVTENLDLARSRVEEAEQESKQSGFPGSVGADQTGHARGDLEVQVLERDDIAVVMGQTAYLDYRFSHGDGSVADESALPILP